VWLTGLNCVCHCRTATHPSSFPQRHLDGLVSDAGAAHLASLRQLTSLDLGGLYNLTAHGLGSLSGFKALRYLCVQLAVPPLVAACTVAIASL
jgi:hypothetical protein